MSEANAITTVTRPQAVVQTAEQLREQMKADMELRAVINDYIKQNMVEGKDYGSITATTKSGKEFTTKPSLFKPGSEKFCSLFKIRATFKRDDDTAEMLGNTAGIIAYICELVDQQGRVIGEGRGTAKTDPRGEDFDINKQVKIAQKRAQIDAVLRTGGLSDFFTQDMEDAPKEHTGSKFRPMTEKQLKWLMDTAFEVNDQLNGEEEAREFIAQTLNWPVDKIPGWKTKEAVDKLKAWDAEQSAALIGSPDIVIDDILDAPLNIDDLPY